VRGMRTETAMANSGFCQQSDPAENSRARSQGKRLGRRPVGEDVVERIREQLMTSHGARRPHWNGSPGKREMAATVSR
jgi:hypothetical protein